MLTNEFKLKSSYYFLHLVILVALVGFGIILTQEMPLSIKIVSILLTLLYGNWILQRHVLLKHTKSIIWLKHIKGNQWKIGDSNEAQVVNLLGSSTVTSKIAILNFASRSQKRSCVIFPDSLNRTHFRHLRQIIFAHTRYQ